jgi:hypothetical protein
MLWGWGGDAECTIIHFFSCCYYVSLAHPCFAILGSSSWSFLPRWFYLACEIRIHMFASWQFSPLNSASVNIYSCDLIRSAECNACVFLAYAICEALTTLSSVFFCVYLLPGPVQTIALPVSRWIDRSIHLLSDSKWCLCGVHQVGGRILAPFYPKTLRFWTTSVVATASTPYVLLFCWKLVVEFTFPLSRRVCCSFRCSSAIPPLGCSYNSTTFASWAGSNFLCLLHSIHSFLVAGLRHRLLIPTLRCWLFVPEMVLGLWKAFSWTCLRFSVTSWSLC